MTSHRWVWFAGAGMLLLLGLAGGCQGNPEQLIKQYEAAPNPPLRASALEKLGALKRTEDFPLFLKAAHDSSALVRRAATLSLGLSGDAKAIDTLGELLADPDPDVQTEAARALAKFNTDKSRAYLLNAYSRQGASARRAIAAVLGPSLADALRHEAKLLWERNLRALESGGPAERVAAAEELGRSGRGDAVERLLPLLGNDSVLLAAGAARGLGAARDRRALVPLEGILKENLPLLREAAADALASLGDPAAVPALLAMSLEGGPAAIAGVRAIGQISGDEARAALCRLAAEGSVEVAGMAARLAREPGGCEMGPVVARLGRGGDHARAALAALEALGGSAGADKVLPIAEGADFELRIAAVNALARMDAPQAGARVLALLRSEGARLAEARQKWVGDALPTEYAEGFDPAALDPDHHEPDDGHDVMGLRREARERTAKLDAMLARVDALNAQHAQAVGVRQVSRDARGPLEVIEDLPANADRLLIALTLAAGGLRADGALEALEPLASEPRVSVRAAACEALGALGTEQSIAVAGRCLDDLAGPVVRGAARGLSRAGSGAVPLLAAALDRRGMERSEVVKALGVLGARDAAPKIASLLGEGGLESVEAAIALRRIGDSSMAPALAAELEDDTLQARLEIVEALGTLGGASSLDALRAELIGERPDIRAAAAKALGRLGDKDPSGTLDALRFDYYALVRRAAEEALGKGRQD